MLIISHRGNLNGPDNHSENTFQQIEKVLNNTSFCVEIDVWASSNQEFYLGHDTPSVHIENPYVFLDNPRFFIHAKNLNALSLLVRNLQHANIFSHNDDPFVLTYPKGYAWVYPGQSIDSSSICVLPERTSNVYSEYELKNCIGICTDYPFHYSIFR